MGKRFDGPNAVDQFRLRKFLRSVAKRWEYSSLPPLRAASRMLMAGRTVELLLSDSNYRSLMWVQWTDSSMHQRSNKTAFNRYPLIFEGAAEFLGSDKPHRILSFGCSTGEEVATLAGHFPRAKLVGVDINPRNLRLARNQYRGNNWQFLSSNSPELERLAPFDAIFCLSVLQKTEMRFLPTGVNGRSVYAFEKFEREVERLDRWLAPGGLLVILNSSYRFCDCSVQAGYRVLPAPPGVSFIELPFDPEGNRLPDSYDRVFFQKSPG